MQLRLPTHNVQRMMPYHFLENHPYRCYSKSKSCKLEKPIVNLRTVQEQRVYGYYHPMLDHEINMEQTVKSMKMTYIQGISQLNEKVKLLSTT